MQNRTQIQTRFVVAIVVAVVAVDVVAVVDLGGVRSNKKRGNTLPGGSKDI